MTEPWYRSRWRVAVAAASIVLILGLLGWHLYNVLRYYDDSYVFDATGPLTLEEIEANFLSRMGEDLSGERGECVYRELEARARAAGDPETLDPATIELLPAEYWDDLDAQGKRLILTQAITTKAFFECPRGNP